MSDEVAQRLRASIRSGGPMRFDDFMREALYGAGGYYERPPIGPSADFVTSPHVHPVFSRLVGVALEDRWRALGSPRPLRLVEVGAGDGTMARELVAGFARAGIALEYTAVDVSAGARDALADLADRVVEDLAEVEPLDPGLIVANELLDNLPFRRFRRRGDALQELRVTLDGDRFVEIAVPAVIDDELEVVGTADGEFVVPSGALTFADDLARVLRTGFALLIDYVPGGTDAPVRGYRQHRVIDDVLAEPGSTDITAGVDLDAVAERARRAGLVAFPSVSQADALRSLGFDDWVRSEVEHQGELLNASRGAEAVRTWEGRGRARLLTDLLGLGSLRWLLLATPGLPEPSWLAAAEGS